MAKSLPRKYSLIPVDYFLLKLRISWVLWWTQLPVVVVHDLMLNGVSDGFSVHACKPWRIAGCSGHQWHTGRDKSQKAAWPWSGETAIAPGEAASAEAALWFVQSSLIIYLVCESSWIICPFGLKTCNSQNVVWEDFLSSLNGAFPAGRNNSNSLWRIAGFHCDACKRKHCHLTYLCVPLLVGRRLLPYSMPIIAKTEAAMNAQIKLLKKLTAFCFLIFSQTEFCITAQHQL